MGDLGSELREYLADELYSKPAIDRWKCRWVMHPEWWYEVRRLVDSYSFRPLWEPSRSVCEPDVLLGLPVEVRQDAGVPRLILGRFDPDALIPRSTL